MAKPYPQSKEEVPYRIALIRVNTGIQGSEKGKVIRVGYPASPKPVVGQPQKLIFRSSHPTSPQLKTGQQALMFLTKHPVDSFLMPQGYYSIKIAQPKNLPLFHKQVQDVQQLADILANPLPALKSKDATVRVRAATVLLAKYRRPPRNQKFEQVPIDAQENTLILNALANADWSKYNPNLIMAFDSLALTPKDGFVRPKRITSPNDYPRAIQNWLKTHADTYRILRFAPVAQGAN